MARSDVGCAERPSSPCTALPRHPSKHYRQPFTGPGAQVSLQALVAKTHLWRQSYAVTLPQLVLVDPIPLIHDAVQAIDVLDEPRPVLPAKPRVQARDALRWYLYVVSRETSDGQYELVELTFAHGFSIHLDHHTSHPRWL